MPGKHMSQDMKRRFETFRDQHGRFWGASVEIETGDPHENLRPLEGWKAPLEPAWARGYFEPPEDVVKMVPRKERAKKGYQVEIDYAKWLENWDRRAAERQKKLADFARGMAATGKASLRELLLNPTPELMKELGPEPMPPRQFIEAMAANNKWATGQSNAIPNSAKLHALLDAMRPLIEAKIERASLGTDPFDDVDDDDAPTQWDAIVDAAIDPFAEDGTDGDALALEEQFDPKATGGKRVPVESGKPKSGKDKGKLAKVGD